MFAQSNAFESAVLEYCESCPEMLCNEDGIATGVVTFHDDACDYDGRSCSCSATGRCPCGCKTELERMAVAS